MKPKVLVIGLDGATLTLLKPWAEQGLLPNINELISKGTSGTLKSTNPPYTPPAWSSFYTGVNPGKHGVYGFSGLNPDTGKREFTNSSKIGSKKLWEILNEHGLRTGLVNLPLSYPPSSVDGIMITGMMTPRRANIFTYPESIQEELSKQNEPYIVDEVSQPEANLIDRLYKMLRGRREACLNMLEKQSLDFMMVVFVAPDRIQHVFWKYLDVNSSLYNNPEAESMRNKIIKCYQFLDEIIGEITSAVDEKCRTFVISDHGFCNLHGQFLFNNWLAEEGYFKLKTSGRRLVSVGRKIRASGLLKLFGSRADKAIVNARKKSLEQTIDRQHTTAYALEQGMFINMAGREAGGLVTQGEAYNEIRQQIAEKLIDYRNPKTGEQVVISTNNKEEIYSGPFVDLAPDLIVNFNNYAYSICESIVRSEIIIDWSNSASGVHHSDGILLAHGPDIVADNVIDKAEIIDIAPTILYSLGLPTPANMDGKVLTGMFETDFVQAHPVSTTAEDGAGSRRAEDIYSQEEAEEMEEQLRGMGYI